MNTIIIHPNNRVARTPEHDLSNALIAPVSPWYRKPTPWWVDGFEEVGLHPIVEADEIAEKVEETKEQESLKEFVLDDEQVKGVDLANEVSASEDVEYTSTDIGFEHSQHEHSTDGADIFEDIALDDIIFDIDSHGMEKDGCCDNMDFFEDVILVDEVDNDDDEADDDDDDTLTDTTFNFHGIDATFRLPVPVQFIGDYEKATLSIVATELGSEDEGEDDTIDWNRSSSETNQFCNNGNGVTPEHQERRILALAKLGSETLCVTTRTACQWWAGLRDGSGYDLGTAYLQLPDDLAVQL